MKCRLVGFSNFQSKDGRQCCIVGLIHKDQYWQGFKPIESFVNPLNVGCDLEVNKDYNVDFDPRGRIISIEPIV